MLDVTRLTMFTDMKVYERGTTLVSEGGDASLFIVAKGEVGLVKGRGTASETLMATVKEGGFFGGLSFFGEQPSSETAIAFTDAIALKIDKDNVLEFLAEQAHEALAVIKGIASAQHKAAQGAPAPLPVQPAASATAPTAVATVPSAPQAAMKTPAASAAKPTTPAPSSTKQPPTKPTQPQAAAKVPSAPQETVTIPVAHHPLFPEGHGSYQLPLAGPDNDILFEKNIKCPMCGKNFKYLAIKSFKLVTESTDPDMRVHYKDIEPLYYEVVVCPDCLFSSHSGSFANAPRSTLFLNKNLAEIKPYIDLKDGFARDTNTVFLSFYLALTCAPLRERNAQLTTGNLWMKIARLYDDANDEKMQRFALDNSLNDYTYVYEKLDVDEGKSRQVCAMLGELCYKTGDYNLARKYFFKVKTDRGASAVLKNYADNRISDMK